MQRLNNIIPLICFSIILTIVVSCSQEKSFSWEIVHQQEKLSFRGISAVDSSVCWVSGTDGTVLKTTDGGKNWENLVIPGVDTLDFRDIEAFDRQTAVVMSAGKGSASQLYKTADGGKSWKKVYENKYGEGFFNAIAFWDGKYGVLQGDPIGGHIFILVTSDGGDSWTEIPRQEMPKAADGEYGFAASGTHLTVEGESTGWLGTGGHMAHVFKTTDKGQSWTTHETPFIAGRSSTGIFSLSFRDEDYGVAVGGDYNQELQEKKNVAVTEDGGASWKLVEDAGLDYRSVVRYTTPYFIAAGPSGSEYSPDGGYSWKSIEGPGFHSISVGAEGLSSVWASGSSGRIAKLNIK
ncbi:WD40/YVTN/BNR-like repeat-containing protein [Fodinibius saliphilus]|uniref:WD40/YVTN/BNR-like repeat-containing protein n=1 Tax=Fodinibius saliphilus TaxID=1920650 RepID=UPI0011081ABF|nr:YCF48-related protein [Fodinibius saliphilus]